MPRITPPVIRRVPEIDIERRERKASGAGNEHVRDLRLGHAVGVIVEDVLHQRRRRPGRIELDADEPAIRRDREEIASITTAFEVLRRCREPLESAHVDGEISNQGGSASGLAHGIELTGITDAVKRRGVVAELEPRRQPTDTGSLDLPPDAIGGIVGLSGVAVRTPPVEDRLAAVADRREDVEVVSVVRPLDGHRVDGVAEALPIVGSRRRHSRIGDRVTDRRDIPPGDGVNLADVGDIRIVA